jgi:hypothetical protein
LRNEATDPAKDHSGLPRFLYRLGTSKNSSPSAAW